MKITREISGGYSGVVPMSMYGNEKPSYGIKEIIEQEYDSIPMTDEELAIRQRELSEICYKQFQRQAQRCETDKIAKDYQNIRFYDIGEGIRVPSVTSIIGWDKDFRVSPEELQQYASRGSLIHRQIEIF